MKDFIKQNIGSVINWTLTLGWIGFVFYLWDYSGIKKPDELNAVGDFLAGVFAPLAFFWLVRGFYQQGKGIEQNSIALGLQAKELKASTDALHLQAEELKNSVQEQKNLIKVHINEQDSKHFSVKPFLKYKGGNFEIIEQHQEIFGDFDEVIDVNVLREGKYEFSISNEGELAKEFVIINPYTGRIVDSKFEIDRKQTSFFNFKLYEDELEKLEASSKFLIYLDIEYHDKYGKKFEHTIRVQIYNYPDDRHFRVSVDKYAYKLDISQLTQS